MACAHVVVLAGGDPVTTPLPLPLAPADLVIAADGGAAAARVLGLDVDLLVGDLDSIDPELRDRLIAAGVEVERHPVAKDRTDLALALDAAMRHRPRRLTVVGGAGGRLDHLLGNLHLLAASTYAGMSVTALMGPAAVHVVRDREVLEGTPGETVSLLPVHGDASGVEARGFAWELSDATLRAGDSRGLSNVFTRPHAEVAAREGVVLVVRPDPGAARRWGQ